MYTNHKKVIQTTAKSIAARATSFKQRHDHTKRRTSLQPDTEIEINTAQCTCKECGTKKWFKFARCPECQTPQ